ncbi:MAG: hypothetical protein IT353_11395 [Gemmatimonadaceae bacterium]|nr:hypothetical protein [Gemmatimonadaceae bacterium]
MTNDDGVVKERPTVSVFEGGRGSFRRARVGWGEFAYINLEQFGQRSPVSSTRSLTES